MHRFATKALLHVWMACLFGLTVPLVMRGSDTAHAVVFAAGEGGIHTFRIPAMVATPRGDILVFAEARKEGIGDASPTDMVLKRSLDGGRSWLPMQILVRGRGTDAIMNPVALADPTSGKIWLMYCLTNRKARGEHRTHFLISRRNGGRTWSKPREMGASIKGYDDTFVPGPGIGIRTRSGRLVIPGYTSVEQPDFKTEKGMHSRVIYSDDEGRTWSMGSAVSIDANECQVAELSDGRLMLNMRQAMGAACRAVALSRDGGAHWDSLFYDKALNERPCQASLLRYAPGDASSRILLFANPDIEGAVYAEDRRRMTLRVSPDDGASWPVRRLVHAGPSSYSGLVSLPDGAVGLVFEGGEKHRREWIRFVRIPGDWLRADRKDSLP
ncbi:MAG: glycoside hydrolase [Chitinophagaceae bacterium]|nr:glycoside hydrolase [Chitinophagaceae bacterium]